jgi:hypothetical protein
MFSFKICAPKKHNKKQSTERGFCSSKFEGELKKKIEILSKLRSDAQRKFPYLLEENNRSSIVAETALGKKIGQIIQLPLLAEYAPKGFDKETAIPHYLLTKQRFELCRELIDFSKKKPPSFDGGFVPSGPHGVGKSSIGLLLANYAFVNGHYLVYIVIVTLSELCSPR